jgi:predicted RND superfamily exporter protein
MKITYLAAHYPKTILLLVVLATGLGMYGLSGIRMDNSLEVWFAKQDPNLDLYQEFKDRFGTEEYLLVALARTDAFSQETMDLVGELGNRLEQLEGLERVDSLARVYEIWAPQREEGGVPNDLESFREDALQSPLYDGMLVSSSGEVSVILGQMSRVGTQNRQKVADEVRAIVAEIVPQDRTVYYAGSAMFNAELNEVSRESAITFYPIVGAAGVLLLLIVLRSIRMTLVAMAAVAISMIWGIGALTATGRALNVVTFSLPAILLVTTTSYALHFLLEYRRQLREGKDSDAALKETLDLVSIPCLLSAVTTSIGFGSLVVGDLDPVTDLGLFAGISVLGAYIIVVYGIGSMALLLPAPKRWVRKEDSQATSSQAGFHFGFQRSWHPARWLIILVGAAYTALSGYYASKVYFESNPFEFFDEDSTVTVSHHYLEEKLTGLSQLEIQIHSTQNKDLLDLEELRKIESVGEKLAALPHVRKVITPADYIKEARRTHSLGAEEAYQLPRRMTQLRQTLTQLMPERLEERLNESFAEDRHYAKMSLRIGTLGSRQYQKVVGDIEETLEAEFGEGYETLVTGLVPLVTSAQKYMVTSQVESLSLAVILIGITFVLLLRSIRLTVLGLLPNLIPILGTFGFMGWRNIALDAATIMVASVSLGIVVDNTIHFLFRYVRHLRDKDRLDSVLETLRTSGEAIAFAGMINCLGFAVLILSDFQPMRHFGMLVSLTMLFAFFGATILLPALLVTLGPKKGKKLAVTPTDT